MIDLLVVVVVGGAAIWIQCLLDEVRALKGRLAEAGKAGAAEGGCTVEENS
jgi:hypothetical protein